MQLLCLTAEPYIVVVEISNNLEIKLQKGSVQATLPKGTIKSI